MFKKTLSIIAITTALIAPSIATADPVSEEVCAINALLAADDATGTVEYFTQMFTWNPAVQKKITNSLKPIENFHYDASNAYLVADFGDIAKEVFITTNMKDHGVMYFRIRYEQIQGQLRAINIHFKNNYPDSMAKGAFAQDPVRIAC